MLYNSQYHSFHKNIVFSLCVLTQRTPAPLRAPLLLKEARFLRAPARIYILQAARSHHFYLCGQHGKIRALVARVRSESAVYAVSAAVLVAVSSNLSVLHVCEHVAHFEPRVTLLHERLEPLALEN